MRANIAAVQDLQNGDMRLDASYHASSGHQALRGLRGAGKRTDRLDQVCLSNGIFIPGRFRRVYVGNPQYGLRWLSPSDMQKADLSGLGFVSRKYTPDLDTLRIQKGWILLSRSGTIGNLVYVRSDMDGLIGSDDIIRIAPDPQKIYSGYLYALLSSPAMVEVIQQKTYGAVIPHIEAHHVVDLPIPRLDPSQEEEIHRLIEQAADLRVGANRLKQTAQDLTVKLLNVELGFSQEERKYTDIPVKELNDRFEASYHVSHKSASAFAKSSYPLIPIANLLERIFYLGKLHRVFVEDTDSGVPLLSISDVQKAKLTSNKFISKSLSRNVNQAKLEQGWVLVSRTGKPGIATYSRNEMVGWAGSDDLIRLVPNLNLLLPGYLFSILGSRVGYQILLGSAHGSVQLKLPPEYIEQIKIPLPPIESQREINDLIEKYGESLTLASEVEDQAQSLLSSYLETPNKPVVSQ